MQVGADAAGEAVVQRMKAVDTVKTVVNDVCVRLTQGERQGAERSGVDSLQQCAYSCNCAAAPRNVCVCTACLHRAQTISAYHLWQTSALQP